MNFWSRTLVYLGLREEPEDAVDWDALESAGSGLPPVTSPSNLSRAAADRSASGRGEEPSNVRPIRSALDTSNDRIAVVQVRVFDDVESIGSRYRVRQPVLFDVSACGRDVARRAVDFVSGLTYASRGSMRRVGPRAFLLVPESVTVPDSERGRLEQLGYDLSVDVTR